MVPSNIQPTVGANIFSTLPDKISSQKESASNSQSNSGFGTPTFGVSPNQSTDQISAQDSAN
jgi:hypothetical protein